MNLGLDIDGVLTNIEEYQFRFGIPFFEEHFNKGVVNENGFGIKEVFDATDEEYKKFWSKYLFKYARTCPPRKNAAEYTKWAYENGHKIYIITARVFAAEDSFLGKLMRFTVKRWLKKHKIRYEEIVFCVEDKTDAIDKYDVRYMVDDNPDNICGLKEHTNIICMNARCNEHIRDEKVKRCHNFAEIIEYMKQQ